MDILILITGFVFGALYNGLAVHISDTMSDTNFYWMIGISAMGTGISGLITYRWQYLFNWGLLCGTGTVFIGMVAFIMYALTCKSEGIIQHKHYCTPICSDVLFFIYLTPIS